MAARRVRFFRRMLGAFVRGQVCLHFDGPGEAEAALRDAGSPQPGCAAPRPSSS